MDIVCSQNDGVGHDFERDGIEVRFTDDDEQPKAWLKPVKSTTLGADNGVALAAGLAVLEALENHPSIGITVHLQRGKLISAEPRTCRQVH